MSEQNLLLSECGYPYLKKATVKESLTVHAQPSCECTRSHPHEDMSEACAQESIKAERDNLRRQLEALREDHMIMRQANSALRTGQLRLQSENAQLKETIKAHEDAFTESLGDTLELIAERDKLQQLLMTALDTGRAAIAERDALKARNVELVSEITKALSHVECSHRPPIKDSLETGRMVYIRLHALADLHAIISKESK